MRAIRQGDLDRLIIPDCPLDILAQQIVAACAAEKSGTKMRICSRFMRAPIPIAIFRARLRRILEMLSEGIAARRGRYGAYLHRDRVNGKLRARRGSRLAAITSGGAIPETALFTVVAEPEGIVVGTLDEDFAVESNAGDIMLLGNTSWTHPPRGRQVRPRAGGRCARRAAQRSLLARRGSGAHAGTFGHMCRTCGKRSAIACATLLRLASRRASLRLRRPSPG